MPTAPGEPKVVAIVPGGFMVLREYPPGVPTALPSLADHVTAVKQGATFGTLPLDERVGAYGSLGKTLRRADYHRQRFLSLRADLDQRRSNLPGEVFWDGLVEVVHFEFQAFCGAARMALDEVVYLIARRHGVAPKDARKRPWETAELFKSALPPQCQVAEVQLMRTMLPWFETLNVYRNSFFHHGWRHGTGHFDVGELRSAAGNPAANALLVPDRASLGSRSKPHERTYTLRTTVDEVVREVQAGLERLIGDLCIGPWATPMPTPSEGRIPREQHPNLIVQFVNPVLFLVDALVVVAFFRSAEKAKRFAAHAPTVEDAELVAIRASPIPLDRPSFTFTLRGLDTTTLSTGANAFVMVDPEMPNGDPRKLSSEASAAIDLAQVEASVDKSMSFVADAVELFVWRAPLTQDWI